MKKRISATVDEDAIKILESLVRTGKYRNMSHAIETAIRLLKKKEDDEK